MPDVFLSYSRDDMARAQQVAEGLQREGFDVFWDQAIPPGRSWSDYLTEKLSACKAVLVLWSVNSAKSTAVREEARIGMQQHKLIPVMLDTSPPPFGFGEVQALSFADWAGDRAHPHWRQLVGALSEAANKPVPPPPASSGWRTPPPPPMAAQGVYMPPADAAAKKKPNPMVWMAAGGAGVLVLLIALGSMMGGGSGGGNTVPVQPPPGGLIAPPGPPPSGGGDARSDVQPKLTEARRAQQEAQAAVEDANTAMEAGRQAAIAAQQGQFGYSSMPLQGGVFSGQIVQLQSGAPAAGALVAQDGATMAGVFQLNMGQGSLQVRGGATNPGGETTIGRFTWRGSTVEGVGNYSGGGVFFEGRTWGPAGATRSEGLGVIEYKDGSRYEGDILSVGSPAVLQRHGVGALYSAKGELREQGRFTNDRLAQ